MSLVLLPRLLIAVPTTAPTAPTPADIIEAEAPAREIAHAASICTPIDFARRSACFVFPAMGAMA